MTSKGYAPESYDRQGRWCEGTATLCLLSNGKGKLRKHSGGKGKLRKHSGGMGKRGSERNGCDMQRFARAQRWVAQKSGGEDSED